MKPAATPDTITLHVPFRVVKRGGHKEVQLPGGAPVQRKTDNTLVKALARAFRDAAGLLNQSVATACDELWLCVAGHPLRIKPQ